MQRLIFLIALLIFMPLTAHAQTAGGACSTAGQFHESGTESLVCDSSVWKSVINFSSSGKINFQVGNDTAGCSAAKTGRLSYSSSTWEYCNGTAWQGMPISAGSDCNIFGQSAGYVCPDGSIFIGFSGDVSTQEPLFATRCDAGMTWNGAACAGTRLTLAYGSSGVVRSAVNLINGQSQSASLASFGSVAHPAAYYCENLVMHGKSDWYLPTVMEGAEMVYNQASISGYSTAQHIITSAEVNSTQFYTLNPSAQGGFHEVVKTYTAISTRCIRRN